MELLPLGRAERYSLVRKRHGSATKLAGVLGVAVSTVTRHLNGELQDEETQARIAKACKVRRAAMFGPLAYRGKAA